MSTELEGIDKHTKEIEKITLNYALSLLKLLPVKSAVEQMEARIKELENE